MTTATTEARRTGPLDAALVALRRPAVITATLSLYAGAVHVYLAPEHFRAWWGYGAFFLAVGVLQIALAVPVARRPGPAVCLAGITGTAAVLAVYVLSRTSGVPVGPAHSSHRLERAGPLDLTVAAVELGVIVLLVSLLPPRVGRIATNALLAAGLGLWALRLSGLLG
jgi:hypothetical protein